MIENERQYKITKSALSDLVDAIRQFDFDKAAIAIGSKALAKAQLQAMETERANLTEQLEEYDGLRSGIVKNLRAASLNELPTVLIKARIVKGWSQKKLAEVLGLKEQQVQRYEAEKYASASFRRLMEVAEALALEVSESIRMSASGEPLESLKTENFDWGKFPLREMYKRNWLKDLDGKDFEGSVSEAEASRELLIANFLLPVWRQPLQAFHKMHNRLDAGADEYSLIAWECRVLRLADKIQTEVDYRKERLTEDWLRELVKLSTANDGPRLARAHLAQAGIAVVVEPHLPRTYLDGAMLMLVGRRPVIGMTLRYDRLDNFWFVLLHELAHLILHSEKNKYTRFFDNLEVKGDGVEQEADKFACEVLLPENVWTRSVARYVRSAESVNQLATRLGLGPWIIAGRLRNESEDYTILRELVGTGEVRKQFPEVHFGQ